MRRFLASVVMGVSLGGVAVNGHANLVAHWDFNAGSSADLTSNVGGYVFTESGAGGGQDTTYNGNGTITLGQGRTLYSTGINSTDLPGLQSNSTIYARMRYDGDPIENSAHVGFIDYASSPPWAVDSSSLIKMGLTRTANVVAPDNASFTGATSDNVFGSGSQSLAVPQSGSAFFTMALVYNDDTDGLGNPSATDDSIMLYIDGQTISTSAVGEGMAAFQSLALGRVVRFSNGNGTMTFDEVRVYDEALTPEQIRDIPEPAALSLAALGAVMTLRRRRSA